MSSVSRRAFLQTTAAAGVMMAGRQARSQAGSTDKISIGVIGCRNRGWQLAQAFHRNGRFDVGVMCDCDDAMLNKGLTEAGKVLTAAPRREKDFRRILEDKSIHAVAIAAPDHWHALMAVMALQAGKHVYLEKPFAFNIADGKAIVAATKKYPRLALQVGTQHRSCAHIREAGDFLQSGGAGKIGFCRCWCANDRPVLERKPDGPVPAGFDYDLWVGPAPKMAFNEVKVHYNWHFLKNYGTGDMGNWGAHWMDSARQMLKLDVPTSAAGVGRKLIDDVKEWPDTQAVVYDFPNITFIWELRNWTTYGPNNRFGGIEVSGSKGTVIVDRDGWWWHPKGDPKKIQPVSHPTTAMEEPHVDNFADCITKGAKPNAPAEEGQRSAILCHLGNIASVLNRRVEFDPQTLSIRNDKEAQAMESREYRAPWKMEV